MVFRSAGELTGVGNWRMNVINWLALRQLGFSGMPISGAIGGAGTVGSPPAKLWQTGSGHFKPSGYNRCAIAAA